MRFESGGALDAGQDKIILLGHDPQAAVLVQSIGALREAATVQEYQDRQLRRCALCRRPDVDAQHVLGLSGTRTAIREGREEGLLETAGRRLVAGTHCAIAAAIRLRRRKTQLADGGRSVGDTEICVHIRQGRGTLEDS